MSPTFDDSDPFRPKRRRRRSSTPSSRRKMYVALATLFGLVPGAIALVIWVTEPSREELLASLPSSMGDVALSGGVPAVDPTAPVLPARQVFRYSVVDGGVHAVDDVSEVIERDPVVAAHYADIDVDKLRVETLTEPLVAHVSYRIDNSVFWTRKRLTLKAGEQVLTDGTNMIRARCGNRVAMAALSPALSVEPDPEEFEHLVAGALLPGEVDPLDPQQVAGALAQGLGDPVPVPEPGTFVLMGAGVLAAYIRRVRNRRPPRAS